MKASPQRDTGGRAALPIEPADMVMSPSGNKSWLFAWVSPVRQSQGAGRGGGTAGAAGRRRGEALAVRTLLTAGAAHDGDARDAQDRASMFREPGRTCSSSPPSLGGTRR